MPATRLMTTANCEMTERVWRVKGEKNTQGVYKKNGTTWTNFHPTVLSILHVCDIKKGFSRCMGTVVLSTVFAITVIGLIY